MITECDIINEYFKEYKIFVQKCVPYYYNIYTQEHIKITKKIYEIINIIGKLTYALANSPDSLFESEIISCKTVLITNTEFIENRQDIIDVINEVYHNFDIISSIDIDGKLWVNNIFFSFNYGLYLAFFNKYKKKEYIIINHNGNKISNLQNLIVDTLLRLVSDNQNPDNQDYIIISCDTNNINYKIDTKIIISLIVHIIDYYRNILNDITFNNPFINDNIKTRKALINVPLNRFTLNSK